MFASPLPSTEIVFRPEVPDVIDWRFEAVRDLLRHRARSPLFADVTFERSLLTFELALRLRHEAPPRVRPVLGVPGRAAAVPVGVGEGACGLGPAPGGGMYRVRNSVAYPTTNLGSGGPGGATRAALRVVEAINDLFKEP